MTAHRTRRIAVLAAFALAAGAGIAAVAYAHTAVVASSPARSSTAKTTISRVTVTFKDRLKSGTLRVTGPGNRVVSRGRGSLDPRNPKRVVVALRRPLRPGTYSVTWRVDILGDHAQSGKYSFRLRR